MLHLLAKSSQKVGCDLCDWGFCNRGFDGFRLWIWIGGFNGFRLGFGLGERIPRISRIWEVKLEGLFDVCQKNGRKKQIFKNCFRTQR